MALMGWNSWALHGCGINETIFVATVNALVSRGLRDAGYAHAIVDDGWASTDRVHGEIGRDERAFPTDMGSLVRYATERDISVGLYLTAGTQTCVCSKAGSLDHEREDAATLSRWNVSTIKYDNCKGRGWSERRRYAPMGRAARDRGLNLMVCTWGCGGPEHWAASIGAISFRVGEDTLAIWETLVFNMDSALVVSRGSVPLRDPDVLVVGIDGLTETEQRSHFAMWVMLRGPLMLSFDAQRAPQWVIDMVTHPRARSVYKDPSGVPAVEVYGSRGARAFAAPVEGGIAVLLVNMAEKRTTALLNLRDVGMQNVESVTDVWTGLNVESVFETTLEPHQDAFFIVKGAYSKLNRHRTYIYRPRCYNDRGVNFTTSVVALVSAIIAAYYTTR